MFSVQVALLSVAPGPVADCTITHSFPQRPQAAVDRKRLTNPIRIARGIPRTRDAGHGLAAGSRGRHRPGRMVARAEQPPAERLWPLVLLLPPAFVGLLRASTGID